MGVLSLSKASEISNQSPISHSVASGFAYALKTYVLNDEKMKENEKFIDMGAGLFANSLTYPLTVVATVSCVAGADLVAGKPPKMPMYNSWVGIFKHLYESVSELHFTLSHTLQRWFTNFILQILEWPQERQFSFFQSVRASHAIHLVVYLLIRTTLSNFYFTPVHLLEYFSFFFNLYDKSIILIIYQSLFF